VLIEALVVLGVLMLCSVGVVGVYEVAGRRLDTVYDARRQAWEQTMSGCNSFPIDLPAVGQHMLQRDWHQIEGLAHGELRIDTYVDDEIAFLLELIGGEDVRVAESHADMHPPAALGPMPESTSTSTLMGCNEEPHDLGTRASLYDWITGIFF
jgi:hypothetical protein